MNDVIVKFLKDNVKGRTCKELADLINTTFNTTYKASNIKYYKRKYSLTSGVDSTFKKGNIPHNKKDVGHEFVDTKTGYTFIKNEFNEYELKHRYIYRKYVGDIPKGFSIAFADTDKTNFDIGNLILIRDKDKLVMKNKHLFFKDKEMTQTGQLLARVINTTYEKKNVKE